MTVHTDINLATFAANARYYASADLLDTLGEVARTPALALVVDVSAMKLDRVIVTALEALAHTDVLPVIVGDRFERLRWARPALERTWFVDRTVGWTAIVADIRANLTEPRIVAFTDQLAARAVLSDRDRLFPTSGGPHMLSLRVALWCIVRERSKLTSGARPARSA